MSVELKTSPLTVKSLEDRIADIEKQVYGFGKTLKADDPQPENSVVDSLLHINTLITSALSGREKANAVMKRLPELNSYLEPDLDESDLPIDAKLQLLLAAEPEINETHRLLIKLQELQPTLDVQRIQNVPELTTKLNELSLVYLKMDEDLKQVSKDVHELFAKYNAVITSISQTLITLDAAVTTAEKAAVPKKEVD